jgi:murein DD-endopeptidase MepM/ murein hydrolase activator NlpD
MFRSPLVRPARITSSFQSHMSDARRNFAGVDLVYADGNNYRNSIVATSYQRVIQVQDNFYSAIFPARNGERFVYTQDIHNPAYTFLYLHNDENLVRQGDTLRPGDAIALMGHSGWTIPDNITGTHLHYEIRINGVRVDPIPLTNLDDFEYKIPQVEEPPTQSEIIEMQPEPGDGISHLLKRAGRKDYSEESAWIETSELNGVEDGLMRVLLGHTYKVRKG